MKILKKSGCPKKFTHMIWDFHAGMQAHGILCEPFSFKNDVIQGYGLAPTFFILMFSVMLWGAFREENAAIGLWYWLKRNCSICSACSLNIKVFFAQTMSIYLLMISLLIQPHFGYVKKSSSILCLQEELIVLSEDRYGSVGGDVPTCSWCTLWGPTFEGIHLPHPPHLLHWTSSHILIIKSPALMSNMYLLMIRTTVLCMALM